MLTNMVKKNYEHWNGIISEEEFTINRIPREDLNSKWILNNRIFIIRKKIQIFFNKFATSFLSSLGKNMYSMF